jgi:hypothetical protein
MRVGRLGSPELIALAGSLLLAMVGLALVRYVGVIARRGAVRAGSTERPRKPPGVL